MGSDPVLLELESGSPEETLRLGRILGQGLRAGDVLGIDGDLGAGKTQLVRGLAGGLDIDPDVVYSPSFTLVAEHDGRLRLNHIDLFRLGEPVARADEDEIGLGDYLDPAGVTAIEWYRKLGERSGTWSLEIEIEIGQGNERTIRLSARTPRGKEILDELRRRLPR